MFKNEKRINAGTLMGGGTLNTWVMLIIKFVMTLVVAFLGFGLIGVDLPAGWIMTVALVATAVNYLVGDLYILPNFGNAIASVGDGIMAGLVAYLIGLTTAAFNPTAGAIITFAILVAIGEAVFHPYLANTRRAAPEPEQEG